jgi:hypothetical protein
MVEFRPTLSVLTLQVWDVQQNRDVGSLNFITNEWLFDPDSNIEWDVRDITDIAIKMYELNQEAVQIEVNNEEPDF